MNNDSIQLQVGVKALLKNPEGKYLLLHRDAEKYPEVKTKWDIVGGRINPGQSLLDNLKREIKEETKLNLIKIPTLIAAQDILRISNRHIVRLTYSGEISGDPILDEDHDEYKWLDISEIKNLPENELDSYFRELLINEIIK